MAEKMLDKAIIFDDTMRRVADLDPEKIIEPVVVEDADTGEHTLRFDYPIDEPGGNVRRLTEAPWDGCDLDGVEINDEGQIILAASKTEGTLTLPPLDTEAAQKVARGWREWVGEENRPLYFEGQEFVEFVEGYSQIEGDASGVSKEADHLYCFAERLGGDPTPPQRTYVTDVPIDLTDVDQIFFDNERLGSVAIYYYFVASTEKGGDLTTYDKRLGKVGPEERNIITLNVESLSGLYYIRFHVQSYLSMGIGEIKVYRIGLGDGTDTTWLNIEQSLDGGGAWVRQDAPGDMAGIEYGMEPPDIYTRARLFSAAEGASPALESIDEMILTTSAAAQLEPGNIVIIPDLDGDMIPFVIRESEIIAGGEVVKRTTCAHLFYELADGPIRAYDLTNAIPTTAINAALIGTRWQVGNVDPELIALTHDFDADHIGSLEMLRLIEREFDAQLRFRVETTEIVVGSTATRPADNESNYGFLFSMGIKITVKKPLAGIRVRIGSMHAVASEEKFRLEDADSEILLEMDISNLSAGATFDVQYNFEEGKSYRLMSVVPETFGRELGRYVVGAVEPPFTSADIDIVAGALWNGNDSLAAFYAFDCVAALVKSSLSNIAAYRVDMITPDEIFSGKRFEFGRDLRHIEIAVDHSNIKTALFGHALGEEIDPVTGDPLPLTFEGEEWSRAAGDPADKPRGQDWVGNEDSRELYGIYDPASGERLHRFGKYESEAESAGELLENTWLIGERYHFNPSVRIEGDVADLEHVKIVGAENMGGPEIVFERDSSAIHPSTGAEISSDIPIFMTFSGNKQGLLIEEGVTNLLAANQSSFETSSTAQAATRYIHEQSAEWSKHGDYSQKIIRIDDPATGAYMRYRCSIAGQGFAVGTPFVAQATLYLPPGCWYIGKDITFRVRFAGGAQEVSALVTKTFTLSEGENLLWATDELDYSDRQWVEYFIWDIDNTSPGGTFFYTDCHMVHVGTYPLSWHLGAATRADSLTCIDLPITFSDFGIGLTVKMLHAGPVKDYTLWQAGNRKYQLLKAGGVEWQAGDIISVYGGRRDGKLFIQGIIAGVQTDVTEVVEDEPDDVDKIIIGSDADGETCHVNGIVADFVLHDTAEEIDPAGYLEKVLEKVMGRGGVA